MAIIAEMGDIFTQDIGLTREEMMILETVLLDCTDLALTAGDLALALEFEDSILDLHQLKRLTAGGILTFWEHYDDAVHSRVPGQGLNYQGVWSALGPAPLLVA
jgi:hypothetical protein